MQKRMLMPQQVEKIGIAGLILISLITVIPIILIVVFIFVQGAPAFSWEFLTSMPSNGMKSGGLWPAIIGTFYLTLGTAIFSVPLGIAAAIYIAEYAPNNQWTRLIRIAIINLAGIPSVVYGLVRTGIVCRLHEIRYQHPGGISDTVDHDPAGDHQHDRRSPALGANFFPRDQHVTRGDPLANHLAHCITASRSRHHHRSNSWP